MRYRYIVSALTFCTLSHCLTGIHAQERADTVRTHRIDEVVVTGTRSAADVRHLSQTVSVVGRKEIDQSMHSSLLPVLTENVPGLFTTSRGIMGYGVSGGAAGAISLRGLSGSTARMMVLVDGHPQYAGIFGHPIADAYQSLLADRVEVLRGPASVIYGSNAMGGVVNIVTRKLHEDGIRTNLHAGYGIYNTVETELTNMVRKGGFYSVVSVSYNRTDGHRENMDFEQYGGYLKLGYNITRNWDMYADADFTHFNASYPGPVSAPLLDAFQRIGRGVVSFALTNGYGLTSGAVRFFYNWGNHWINDGYTPSAGETSQDGRFSSFDNMMGVSLYQSVRIFKGNRTTFGFDWFRYGGKAWTDYVSGEKAGTRRDLVDKHEDEFAGYIDFRQHIVSWFTLSAGIRVDNHSRAGTEWIPQAGLAFHLPYSMELKASAAKGFRYPVIREMYMFPPQNPDLKPESMWNYEIAFSQDLLGNMLHYGINIFCINGKNLIMTLPNPNGPGMLNQNSGKISNAGVEFDVTCSINSDWTVDANYSFLHMENPVIAAPEHKLYVGGNYTRGRWSVSSGIQYIAGLYTSVGENPATERFVLWNLRGQFSVLKWLKVWIMGENLLAQKYEINAGYPMPRATVIGGINIHLANGFKKSPPERN
ncbi:MAG: TonB-dependent receptor [Candidatus Aphodosoma sp.]